PFLKLSGFISRSATKDRPHRSASASRSDIRKGNHMFSYDHKRRMRGAALSGLVLALIVGFAPQVLATDIADIGFVDQSALGQLGPFVAAQQQFAQFQRDLGARYQAAIKGKSQADKAGI